MKKRLLVNMKERFQFKRVTQHLTLEVETAMMPKRSLSWLQTT